MRNYRSSLLLVLLIFTTLSAFSQTRRYTIGGVVRDAQTNETLIGVPIGVLSRPTIGVSTNENGFYSLTLPEGEYTFRLSYLGYEVKEVTVVLNKNISQDILLTSSSIDLEELIVTDRRHDENVTSVQTGVEKLSVQQINKLPVLMGERDVIKALELMPGVKSAGEGSGGFFVRGGTSDQNSILLDNAPIYNASHLMGFFSTFNSDAIKDVTLYKGAMPAQYGGRLASVLDVQMKDGDNQNFHTSGGIGLISSKLSFEGPLQKGKSSFLVSGRRTYADMIAKASGVEDAKDASLYFYDLNMKLNYILSPKDQIFFSGYLGRDKLGVKNVMNTDWGNLVGALRWSRMLNNKMFMNTSLIYNSYSYDVNLDMSLDMHLSSRIHDYTLKQDFNYIYSPASSWRFGYSSTYHDVAPGKYEYDDGEDYPMQHRYSWENDAYINNTLEVSDRLEVLYGVRLTALSVLGKGDFYRLDENNEVIGVDSYKSGEFVKTYFNIQPRLSMAYKLNDISSVKAAYGRTVQNMHLLSNTAVNGPMDRWASSSNYIKPQVADQVTLGYFRNFSDNMFEFSVEAYYKDMKNQIDFKDHAKTYKKDDVETELLFGKGRAYGVELMVKKRLGRLTGWVGYTLSKSEKQIDGINENKWYDATQDRTHDISIVGIYELNKKWTLSGTWVYYTGNAVTYPSGKMIIDGQEVPYYKERNGYRAPAYHRLDLGAVCKLKDTKKFYSELSFSLYNAYGRENAYMIEFKENKDDPSKMTAYQYALFKFVPSVSWNFKF